MKWGLLGSALSLTAALLIVAGGAVLAWPTVDSETLDWVGPLAITAACLSKPW